MPRTLHILENEIWLEEAERFIKTPEVTIEIEHSLYSIQKWEGIWKKPFLNTTEYTRGEFASYVECMTLTKDIPYLAYKGLSKTNADEVLKYMADQMTATTISSKQKKSATKIVTAEVIYYWMIELGIPFECQYWHLNKLMTLIAVCFEKNGGQKKMSDREILSQYASLNAARRAKMGTKG